MLDAERRKIIKEDILERKDELDKVSNKGNPW